MSEKRLKYEDEIDLLEVLKTLWDGKWVIITFLLFGVLWASVLHMKKIPAYEAKIIYSINTVPPFTPKYKVVREFKKIFNNESMFLDWKKDKKGVAIFFKDFALTENINGVTISTNEGSRLATMVTDASKNSFLLVRTNKLPLLEDFFNYANHVNNELKNKYIVRAKEEINLIEKRFSLIDSSIPSQSIIIKEILLLERYILALDKAKTVFTIQHPTMPRKVSPESKFTFILSLLLGLIAGMFFILIRKLVLKNKVKLAKSS